MEFKLSSSPTMLLTHGSAMNLLWCSSHSAQKLKMWPFQSMIEMVTSETNFLPVSFITQLIRSHTYFAYCINTDGRDSRCHRSSSLWKLWCSCSSKHAMRLHPRAKRGPHGRASCGISPLPSPKSANWCFISKIRLNASLPVNHLTAFITAMLRGDTPFAGMEHSWIKSKQSSASSSN